MDKEKEIAKFKPSRWLYIFLFIDYSIWLFQGFKAIGYYYIFGLDQFDRLNIYEWLSLPTYLIAGIYSLYAVIKTLRGDSDCITALKWSLVISFLYTCLNPARAQIPTYNTWIIILVFFLRPAFYVVFYLYLCFAKGIKLRYPKERRKFAPSGWVWAGIFVTYLVVMIFTGYREYQLSQPHKPIDIAELNLANDEVSDGYVLFKSNRDWEIWQEPIDTLYLKNRIEALPTLTSIGSKSRIYLMSGKCLVADVRTHNQVIVSSFYMFNKDLCGDKVKEVMFTDTMVSSNKLMSTVFMSERDSTPVYFTIATIKEERSTKCSIFLRLDTASYDKSWATDLARSARFELNNIYEGKNKEEGNDGKHNQTYWIDNHDHHPNYNMSTPLRKG